MEDLRPTDELLLWKGPGANYGHLHDNQLVCLFNTEATLIDMCTELLVYTAVDVLGALTHLFVTKAYQTPIAHFSLDTSSLLCEKSTVSSVL